MFGNDPWHTEIGPTRRWHCFGIPFFLVVGIALVWLLQYGGLLSSLAEWFLTPDGDTTLELPDDLVLARLPWSYTWNADPGADGVLLSLLDEADPTRPFIVERWSRSANGKGENGGIVQETERGKRVGNNVEWIHDINNRGDDHDQRAVGHIAIDAVGISADQAQHRLKIRPRFLKWFFRHRRGLFGGVGEECL